MTKIIYNNPDKTVSVVTPAKESCDMNSLKAKCVPAGCENECIEHDFVFPVDRIFRSAWRWEGKGKPVLEDLALSQEVAIKGCRAFTLEEIKRVTEANFFEQTVERSADDVKTACSTVEADIKACTDVYAVKLLYCAFLGMDEPELPRDEKLKKAAEAAKAKIKAKLEAIKEAVKDWYDEKVPTVGPMPTPEPEVAPAVKGKTKKAK